MKQIFSIIILFSFSAKAQVDSSQIKQTVTLPLKFFSYIQQSINRNDVPTFLFFKQVANQMDTVIRNDNQPITVTTTSAYIKDIYEVVSNVPERIGNPRNNQIKDSLSKYITNPWLGGVINTLGKQNAAEVTNRDTNGWNYFKSIK